MIFQLTYALNGLQQMNNLKIQKKHFLIQQMTELLLWIKHFFSGISNNYFVIWEGFIIMIQNGHF